MADLGATLHSLGSAITSLQEGVNLASGRSDSLGVFGDTVQVKLGPPFSTLQTEKRLVPSVPFPASPIDNRFELLAQATDGPPDTTPPTITNFVPPPGTQLGRSSKLGFDLVDNVAIKRGMVIVAMGGRHFCVHDGDNFLPGFGGTRVVITDALHRFSNVTATTGWLPGIPPDTGPRFRFLVTDTAGQEAT